MDPRDTPRRGARAIATTFLDLQPKTKAEAIPAVMALTADCDALRKRIIAANGTRALRGLFALFNERNEVRMRIVKQFGLEEFAACYAEGLAAGVR